MIVEDATTYYREDRRTEDFEDTRYPTPWGERRSVQRAAIAFGWMKQQRIRPGRRTTARSSRPLSSLPMTKSPSVSLAFQDRYQQIASPFEWTFTRGDLTRLMPSQSPLPHAE